MLERDNCYCLQDELYQSATHLLRTTSDNTGLAYLNGDLKRLFDRFVAWALFIGSTPFTVVALIAVLTADRHNPFIKLNFNNPVTEEDIAIWKIRSMLPNAQKREASVVMGSPLSDVKRTRSPDPRITNVGRILRRLSIDETPQLAQAGLGRLALFGYHYFTDTDWELGLLPNKDIDPFSGFISAVKRGLQPGFLGLYGIYERSILTLNDRVGLEWLYSDRANFFGNLRILGHTVIAVLSQRGAR
ncbi:hypothetical protein A3A46_03815 [Candidatus Roizmanbacteria bacterium RIFCSPLOWO2_01_FULL_37_13]|uniref:Bacterial sugar transferase domain-containing protein n=1 Tax=Candidatus Roizmanbacteria bacterium RIFCSPHIGHO2_02_FULL_38_11 TaxID=1802039 RepID=A0A1F7H2A5_9BACT|nr:MAG: hypothetical protein A3C25_01070 [Candidatus Roizmanbacteria bacterium RIFCSPHIGHO2_02_FULL_38_11]OGK32964.1 MAG: hypothetical protein A3F58_00225 [Candidatus Roizmanbacteria bacterium RIFCSPHIGHO2_12_FULL_37_9b]OGK42117.1 MAG: hypothetical protein A3A46_03815 [Candidatus Roizmanbacteria bacterium RIFCSPLOWO2_01_FULL_37_13]